VGARRALAPRKAARGGVSTGGRTKITGGVRGQALKMAKGHCKSDRPLKVNCEGLSTTYSQGVGTLGIDQ